MSKTTPKDLAKKRNDEKLLVSEMIALYCRTGPDRALPLYGDENLLLCLQSSLLQTGNAGADPYCHALGRAADAAGASHPFHPACGRHIEIEAGSPGRKISTHV